jgi:hypothetical protein
MAASAGGADHRLSPEILLSARRLIKKNTD